MKRYLLPLILLTCQLGAADEISVTQRRFFEEHVRPLLADRCFRCHSEKKHESNLRLDGRHTILAGGDSGPAIVPGKPDESLLLDAVRYRSLEMPPDRRLSQKEVDILARWVEMGAPWPGAARGETIPVPRSHGLKITDADRSYWAFQPIRRPQVPNDPSTDWDDHSPVDAFVLRKLQANQLAPANPASRRVLIRRLYFDLIGIPPSYDEVERFVADPSPDALAQLVDDLPAT